MPLQLFKHGRKGDSITAKVARLATRYPSLVVGFLPFVGGAISTPMQINEINRDQAKIEGWRRVALASVLTRSRTAFPSADFNPEGPLSSSLKVATGREPRRVVEKHLQRIELMRRAVQHPTFTVRVARQAALQRNRRIGQTGPAFQVKSFYWQQRRDALLGRTEFANRGFNLGQKVRQARELNAKRRALDSRRA